MKYNMSMLRSIKAIYHYIVAVVANIWFGFPGRKLTIVGVTGTDGKTTTTTLIYHILKKAGKRVSMITSVHAVIAGKTYDTGFHVTTPNAWWVQKYLRKAVNHGDEYMILEVTSHALSQFRVYGVLFAVGVITNVTHEHLDWHGTFDSYFQTKLSLFNAADTCIVNRDEKAVYDAFLVSCKGKRHVSYGLTAQSDVSPKTYLLRTKLPGEFNTYNALAAAAAAKALGIEKKTVLSALSTFSGIIGRMETIAQTPVRVIVDFAHTPNAIEKALKAAKETTKGRLIHVFGSAGLRDVTKRPAMGAASSKFADIIILTEEDYRTEDVHKIIDAIAEGIAKNKTVYREPDRMRALQFALSLTVKGDTVMVTGKGHEKSLCRGKTEYPWSDQEALKQLLRKQ